MVLEFRAVDMGGSDWHSQMFIQMLFPSDSAFGFALKLSQKCCAEDSIPNSLHLYFSLK